MRQRSSNFESLLRGAFAALALLATPAVAQAPDPQDDLKEIVPPAFSLPDDKIGGAPPVSPHSRKSAEADAGSKQKQPAPNNDEQRDALLKELYGRLATAGDEQAAAPIVTAIEQLWSYSGSATADLLADRALAFAHAGRRDLALKLLTTAVELKPDFAEGWNRRAYINYLENDTEQALGDLRRVLALEPNHFKALEGVASILQNAGEKSKALKAYESILKIYPKMPGVQKAHDDLEQELKGQGI